MLCNCNHCLKIKEQITRSEQRQALLFKERNYKLNIK